MTTFEIPLENNSPDILRLHENLEVPNWAPWLRFSPDELQLHRTIFPQGQIELLDDMGQPKASLDTIRTNWDGSAESLGTWDQVAGANTSYIDEYDANGNAIALLSMSVRPDSKKEGLATKIIKDLQTTATKMDVEHIIGDFRPSNFGAHKSESGIFDFEEYIAKKRDDEMPSDGWLRALSRLGMEKIKVDPRAMVVPATTAELAEYSMSYRTSDWYQVTDTATIEYLVGWHKPDIDLESIDEVWECGETGTWYIDKGNEQAVYIESNVWGRIPTVEKEPKFRADYDLSDEVIREFEGELVETVRESLGQEEGIYGVWISPSHKFSNVIRTLEARTPEFEGIENVVDDSVEARSLFYALIDTRNNTDRIIHATRVSGAVFDQDLDSRNFDDNNKESTGFIAINELTNSGQDFTVADFKEYYENLGVDLDSCIGVETNFTVGEKTDTGIDGVRVSDLGYIALFLMLESKGLQPNKTSVFSFVNSNTLHSLGALGVEFEPLAGRPDLKVPSTDGGFSPDFQPVRIPISDSVVRTFTALTPFAVPEIRI